MGSISKADFVAMQERLAKGKHDNSTRQRSGAYTEQEEQQVSDTGKADNKTRVSKGDKENHRRFRVRITFRFSDNRRRDLDGGLSTVLDCIIAARGRLLDMDTRDKRQRVALP